MNLFSERYGYIKPSEAIIVECMPKEIANAIFNCFDNLKYDIDIPEIQREVCVHFFNEKGEGFSSRSYYDMINPYITNDKIEWYKKLDLIEFLIDYFYRIRDFSSCKRFASELNSEFERLNYGYRIINNRVTPITAKEEVESIEEAINNAKGNIKEHLNCALLHLADKEAPDYRNSIKESISAVGALCREMAGENDLGKALSALEKKHGLLHPQLKAAFSNLYNYVNEKQSGIRHELMDENGTYVPTYHEAKFMLVTCTAFINYMNGKFA
ncbi:MAG: hypothetical protein IJV44_09240 [Prevotella sp.]|nr:hypothetical protein [Prevotella sp.]